MNLPFAMTLPEKIATVMQSRKTGALGTFLAMDFGRYVVDVEGTRAIISGNAHGWLVRIVGKGHMIANDRDLETAIRLALESQFQ